MGTPFAEHDSTRWSLVFQAAGSDARAADEALEELCQHYWLPVYAFVRRSVRDEAAAQDLTQDFFVQLLEKRALRHADPTRGRFRAFLLASVRHFLANARTRERAQKRGGGRPLLSLDFAYGESVVRQEPVDVMDPQRIFDMQWATVLTARVLDQLADEWRIAGRAATFEALRPFLTGATNPAAYASVANQLGMTAGAVRVAVHRARRRYGELLRREIAETVTDPADVDDEIRALFATLSNR